MVHKHRTMKLLLLLPNSWANSIHSPSSAPPHDDSTAPSNGPFLCSPTVLFWFVLHALCCIVNLALDFYFSRLLFAPSSSSHSSSLVLLLQCSADNPLSPHRRHRRRPSSTASCIVIDCHGILIRPWPHSDPDQEIAVKKLSRESQQGMREFTNELRLLLNIQHHNLVSLLSCCASIGKKMLVYPCPTFPTVALITSSMVSLSQGCGRGGRKEEARGREKKERRRLQCRKRSRRRGTMTEFVFIY